MSMFGQETADKFGELGFFKNFWEFFLETIEK